MSRYRVEIVNCLTRDQVTITLPADHPETARSLALVAAFRWFGWRHCMAVNPGVPA